MALTLRRVTAALKAAELPTTPASPSDWDHDGAVWVGDTTLVALRKNPPDGPLLHVVTIADAEDSADTDVQVLTADDIDATVLATIRGLYIRDMVVRALVAGVLEADDLRWATARASALRGRFGYGRSIVFPSGAVLKA